MGSLPKLDSDLFTVQCWNLVVSFNESRTTLYTEWPRLPSLSLFYPQLSLPDKVALCIPSGLSCSLLSTTSRCFLSHMTMPTRLPSLSFHTLASSFSHHCTTELFTPFSFWDLSLALANQPTITWSLCQRLTSKNVMQTQVLATPQEDSSGCTS